MEQYIIVKVRDAKSCFPENVLIENGKAHIPTSNMAKIRKAIHRTSEEQFISVADMVSHTRFMTPQESAMIAQIFEKAMARAKGI